MSKTARQAEAIAQWAEQQANKPVVAKSGRPPKFETPEAMQIAIDAYFAQQDLAKQPYTMSGLARALGTTRKTVLDYEGRDGFSDTVKSARARVEEWVETQLYGNRPVGPIFSLKNNFGWRDQVEVEHTLNLAYGGLIKTAPPGVIDVQVVESTDLSLVPRNDLACGKQG